MFRKRIKQSSAESSDLSLIYLAIVFGAAAALAVIMPAPSHFWL